MNQQIQLRYPLPNLYPITQHYGDNPGAYAYPCRSDQSHSGIDYGCPAGTPVLAAADGIVTKAGWDTSGYGVMIKVAHGMWGETLYGHLESLACAIGDMVHAGALIGVSGSSGNSTGPHLHFELHKPAGTCKQAIDPEPYIIDLPPDAIRDTPPKLQADNHPPPDPAPVPILFHGKVIAPDGIHIRTGPSRLSPDVGHLPQGYITPVIGAPVENMGVTWAPALFWIADKEGDDQYLEHT